MRFLVVRQLRNPRGQWIPASERGALPRMMKLWEVHRKEARSAVAVIRAWEVWAVVRAGRSHPCSDCADEDLTRRVEDLIRAQLRLMPHHRGPRKALRDPKDRVRVGLMKRAGWERHPRCVITAEQHVIWPNQLLATQRALAVQLMFHAAAIEAILGQLQTLSVLTPEEVDRHRDRVHQDIVEEFWR